MDEESNLFEVLKFNGCLSDTILKAICKQYDFTAIEFNAQGTHQKEIGETFIVIRDFKGNLIRTLMLNRYYNAEALWKIIY